MSETKLGHGPLSSWSSMGVGCFAIIYLRCELKLTLGEHRKPAAREKTVHLLSRSDDSALVVCRSGGNSGEKLRFVYRVKCKGCQQKRAP
jgi:hypothetical protein